MDNKNVHRNKHGGQEADRYSIKLHAERRIRGGASKFENFTKWGKRERGNMETHEEKEIFLDILEGI